VVDRAGRFSLGTFKEMTELKECSKCRSLKNHGETKRMGDFAVLWIVCDRCGHSKAMDIRKIPKPPTINFQKDIRYFDQQVEIF
jgi:hypothetical protein